MTEKKQWVSASDVGQTAFCPHALELKTRGVALSKRANQQMRVGQKHHDRLNERIESDKRCFIATYLYGQDDVRTQQLRRFRDQHLLTFFIGRWAVNGYYFASPYWVRLCQKNRVADRVSRKLLNSITKKLTQ